MIKTVEGGVPVYEIRHAGVDKTVICEEDFEGCKFKVKNFIKDSLNFLSLKLKTSQMPRKCLAF